MNSKIHKIHKYCPGCYKVHLPYEWYTCSINLPSGLIGHQIYHAQCDVIHE